MLGRLSLLFACLLMTTAAACATARDDPESATQNLQDSLLDPTFGSGGRVPFPMNGDRNIRETVRALAVQPDGKTLVLTVLVGGAPKSLTMRLTRLLPNGALDSTFGRGGRVDTKVYEPFVPGTTQEFRFLRDAIRFGRDGKIVVVLETENRGVSPRQGCPVFRYLPNGELDASFGEGGRVEGLPMSVAPVPTGLALLPDGTIFVAAVGGGDDGVHLFRVDVRGRVERLPTLFESGSAELLSLEDGRVIADDARQMKRLLADGSIDPTFVGDPLPELHFRESLARGPGGDLFGFVREGFVGPSAVVRYDADGRIVRSYGEQGFASVDPDVSVRRINPLPDGRVVLVGRSDGGFLFDESFCLLRLTPKGSLDPTWGGPGGMRRITVDAEAMRPEEWFATTNGGPAGMRVTTLVEPFGAPFALRRFDL